MTKPTNTPETDAIITQLWGRMESTPIPNRIRDFARRLETQRNDLLAALEDMLRWTDGQRVECNATTYNELCDNARSAIANARKEAQP